MNAIIRRRVSLIRALYAAALQNENDPIGALVADRMRERDDLCAWSKTEPGKVSYAQHPARGIESPRMRTSLQRYIRRNICTDAAEISDPRIDALVIAARANTENAAHEKNGWTVVSGDALREAYRIGHAYASCMCDNYDSPPRPRSQFTALWYENPERVHILMHHDPDIRALVFKTDCGAKVLDRVYPASPDCIARTRAVACALGYVLRDGNAINDDGSCYGKMYTVTLREPSNGMWPFSDTFRYVVEERDGSVTLSTDPDNAVAILSDPCGSRDECHGQGRNVCAMCGQRNVPDDDWLGWSEVLDAHVCLECYSEHVTCCEACNDDTLTCEAHFTDDGTYCESCYDDLFTCCYHCENSVLKEETVLCYDNGESYCPSCAEMQLAECERCGDHILEENAVTLEGISYCSECSTQIELQTLTEKESASVPCAC